MRVTKTVSYEVEVEVKPSEFPIDDLIDDLEGRGYIVHVESFKCGASEEDMREWLKKQGCPQSLVRPVLDWLDAPELTKADLNRWREWAGAGVTEGGS